MDQENAVRLEEAGAISSTNASQQNLKYLLIRYHLRPLVVLFRAWQPVKKEHLEFKSTIKRCI